MDLFHVVHLAAEKLTACQQRGLTGGRGKKIDPLFMSRKTLLTRVAYLTKRQWKRLEVTWLMYQDIIAAYTHPTKTEGRKLMLKMMSSIRKGVPEGLEELAQLGRILWHRREYILAYFDIGASNGPVEAINGRAEHLHGIAWRASARLCTRLIYKRFVLAFSPMQSLPKTGRSYFNIK